MQLDNQMLDALQPVVLAPAVNYRTQLGAHNPLLTFHFVSAGCVCVGGGGHFGCLLCSVLYLALLQGRAGQRCSCMFCTSPRLLGAWTRSPCAASDPPN
jgi:hypothetical protein